MSFERKSSKWQDARFRVLRGKRTGSMQSSVDSNGPVEPMQDEARWIHNNVNMRVCSSFVPNPKLPAKCECGVLKEEHQLLQAAAAEVKQWSSAEHTVEVPTNAFGEVAFVNEERFAKYARVSNTSDIKVMLDLLFNVWKLKKPNLIISVTGGAMDFRMPRALSTKFRAGLMKVAHSTGAWITTGGTRTGVMQHVGRAMKTHSIRSANSNTVVCLGIASWGIVCDTGVLTKENGRYDAEKAQYAIPDDYRAVQERLRGAYLDPYHTHFLLVDNGTVGRFAVEIALRAALEAEIVKMCTTEEDDSVQIPICCVILEGGPGSLETVMSAAKQGTPVIVAKGSGRVANVLAEAYEHLESQPAISNDQDAAQLFSKTAEVHFTGLLKALVKDPQPDVVPRWFGWLQNCMKYRHLITVVSQDSDLDLAILSAMLNSRKRNCKMQLQLSIAWNRIDAAREILHKATINEDQLKAVLSDVSLAAITLNRVEFLREFLNYGLKPQAFLSVYALSKLYNSLPNDCALQKLLIEDENGAINLRDVGKLINQLMGDLHGHTYMNDLRYSSVRYAQFSGPLDTNVTQLDEMLTQELTPNIGSRRKLSIMTIHSRPCFLTGQSAIAYDSHFTYSDLMSTTTRLSFGTKHSDGTTSELTMPHFDDPSLDLFTYAVLLDRRDLAMVFFRKVSEPLAAALMACKLCHALNVYADDAEQRLSFTSNAAFFESVAIRLLNTCYASLPSRAHALLIRRVRFLSMRTCLQLAHDANCRAFISQPCCQSLLKRTWFGSISSARLPGERSVVACCFLPPLILSLDFKPINVASFVHSKSDTSASTSRSAVGVNIRHGRTLSLLLSNERNAHTENRRNSRESSQINLTDLQALWTYCSPFFHIPLVVFTYRFASYLCFLMLLSYHSLFQFGTSLRDDGMFFDVLLYIWVASLLLDEFIDAIGCRGDWLFRLHKYLDSIWNRIMLCALACFLFGQLLLLISATNAARVFNALSILLFFIRMLQLFAIHKRLGPIVVVAGRMLVDLCFFMILMFVLVCGWGVAQFSLLFPNSPAQFTILRDMLVLSYWQMHGDLRTDVIGQQPYDSYDLDCTNDPELYGNYTAKRCPDPVGQTVVPILLAAFVLSTNLLMFNLLIAVFNYSYEKVKEESEQFWCFQRYELVTAFNKKSAVVPPLTILSHGYMAIQYLLKKKPVQVNQTGALRLNLDVSLRPIDDAEVRIWLATQRDEFMAQFSNND